ncbi:putative sensor with HAMP domain [Catenulispora acidiphila DSM 44928]|uniref:histidine kinase n=1 Tax=Catenulispora acidiphila (strain DSM 44928 / JCM 14897 / NBRC 102108 / NRRL B-24433 / ID139908) TaxID=479433 RepID=C7Q7M8_CATAD|nr:nitrate- and nitrite sensing domain-containing protein [Catenulispora acidiphila]ACU72221.1 putative sensor with HAMP domain [Catenulispora acidiphila DSM 44928]
MRITKKLGILVAVPLCAVSGFGALALVTSTSGAISAGHLYTLMNSATAAGDLVAELQAERTQVASYLTSAPGSDATALNNQIAKTQAATAAYEDKLKNMPWLSSDGKALLSRIDGELRSIDTLRHLILGNSPKTLSSADFQYHIVIADLLSYHDLVQNSGASNQVATMLRATSALSEAREALSGEEADVLRTMGEGQTASAAQDLISSRSSYASAMESFGALAPASWQDEPNQVLGGAGMSNAGQLEDAVAQTPMGAQVSVQPQEWTPPLDARLRALDGVRHDMDLATLDLIAKDRTHQRELAGIEAAAIAGTVLLALMVSLRLGRPIIKGLRGLRDGAHAVAFEDLPAAVQALRSTGSLTGQTPEEFADEAAGGLPVKGDDEIAAVARAFNAVRREAIRTAAEQVLLRAGVGAAFVALARRGERLTGALTLELDKAERDEQDPDRLARLFVLDHLAARMTRNNESLLVLGGEGTVRVRDEGVPLIDVIRGAAGRVERYSRVDLVNVDMSVVVAPPVVDHLVHLCAELLDNATAFSSPDSRVLVDMRVLADRIIVQITDRGIGMTPRRRSELNARLTTPTHLDAASVKAMGLTVAGQLASWYGIAVELRQNPQGGTIAELVLPPTLYWVPGAHEESFASLPATAVNSLTAAMGQTGGYNPSAPAPMPSVGAASQPGAVNGGRRRRGAVAPEVAADQQFGAPAAGFDPNRRPSPFPHQPASAMDAAAHYGAPQAGIAEGVNGFPPAPIRVRPLSRPAGPANPSAPAGPAGEPVGAPGTGPGVADGPLSPWLAGALRGRAAAEAAQAAQAQAAQAAQAQAVQAAQAAAQAAHPSYQTQAQPEYQVRAAFEPPAQPSFQGRPSFQTQQSQPAYPAAPAPAGSPPFQGQSSYQARPTVPAQPSYQAQPALPTAAPGPVAVPPAAAPAQERTESKTTHGLPKRVPLARLPAEAMDEEPEAASPAERDPSRVSASMVAYARGIGGRGAPGSAPQTPYTPPSSTGTF